MVTESTVVRGIQQRDPQQKCALSGMCKARRKPRRKEMARKYSKLHCGNDLQKRDGSTRKRKV